MENICIFTFDFQKDWNSFTVRKRETFLNVPFFKTTNKNCERKTISLVLL
jgi:hypothetical protein